jgi:hypothetical protein
MSMTFEQALEAFKAEFPGWWWKVGECHVSCCAADSCSVGYERTVPPNEAASLSDSV